jgi:hypothetical protein
MHCDSCNGGNGTYNTPVRLVHGTEFEWLLPNELVMNSESSLDVGIYQWRSTRCLRQPPSTTPCQAADRWRGYMTHPNAPRSKVFFSDGVELCDQWRNDVNRFVSCPLAW